MLEQINVINYLPCAANLRCEFRLLGGEIVRESRKPFAVFLGLHCFGMKRNSPATAALLLGS